MATIESQDRYYYSAGDIYGVLRAMQTERSSVNVQFENGAQLYNTMIIDANLKDRFFLLDEVTPRDGHRSVELGTPFSLRASINGIKVHAKGLKSVKTLTNDSGMFYAIPFPNKLLYLQRRDAFRAHVPGSLMTVASCSSPDREEDLHGKILNMSATGVRLAFPGEVKPDLTSGEEFDTKIRIQTQDQDLECLIEIVYYEYSKIRNQTICGCRYIRLQRPVQIVISRFVTFLQREGMV